MLSLSSIWFILLLTHLLFILNATSSHINTPPPPPSPPNSPDCKHLTFLLRATAHNTYFLHPPSPTSATSILTFLHTSYSNSSGPLTNGTHTIHNAHLRLSATYCRPLSQSHRIPPRTLQLLAHGTTYNRTIWSGLGLGHDDYDYTTTARARGYHILTVDLLGHGKSIHRHRKGREEVYDGLELIQPPLQTEVLHSLIRLLRHGPVNNPRKGWRNPLPYRFEKVVYVGHGYGAELGTRLAGKYPRDVDVMIQTSPVGRKGFEESVVGKLVPARMVDGERFGKLPLTYLTFGTAEQREKAFYGGFYEVDDVPAEDFGRQGTITLGEAVYPALLREGEVTARGYKWPVMLVGGERDALFCGADPDENEESCRKKLVEMGKRVWPDSRRVKVYVARETGHTWMMHYSARITMWRIHNWLDGVLRQKLRDGDAVEGGQDWTYGQLVMGDGSLDEDDELESDGE